jgi:hypothetical protein
MRNISISRPPKENDQLRQRLWKPCYGGMDETCLGPSLYDPVEACADSNISLCEMMRRISCTMYFARSTKTADAASAGLWLMLDQVFRPDYF